MSCNLNSLRRRGLALAELGGTATVPPRTARELLDLSNSTITHRADTEVLKTTRNNLGHRLYYVESILNHLLDRKQEISLFDLTTKTPGDVLSWPEYRTETQHLYKNPELRGRWWRVDRRNIHQMPGDPAWERWKKGDREGALRLLERERPTLMAHQNQLRRNGILSHRLWIPDLPLNDCAQFLSLVLHQRAIAGQLIHVIPAPSIPYLEHQAALPETTVFGGRIYRIIRSPSGELQGAVRITNPDLTNAFTTFLNALTRVAGEQFLSFYSRYGTEHL